MRRPDPSPGGAESHWPALEPTGSDRLADALAAWARDAQVDETIGRRRRERWLRRQAEEEATFAGVLVDLAEAAAPVTIATPTRKVHRGRVRAVGTDFALVEVDGGRHGILRHRAIAWARQDDSTRPARGDRPLALSMTFEQALRATLEPHELVQVVAAGPAEPVDGEVIGLGADVLTLRRGDRSRVHLPLANVDEVLLERRG